MIFYQIYFKYKKAIKQSSGFSLLELVVGLGIATLSMLAVISVFTTLTRSYTIQTTSAHLQQAARVSLDYMTQNIRMAGFNPRRNADAGITEATPTSISFKLDRDSSGEIDAPQEDMAYVYESDQNEIEEVLNASTAVYRPYPLLDHVTDLTFVYFDSSGKDLGEDPDLSQIKTVDIFLTVEQRPGRERKPVSRTYSARVICRNLGL
jgi:type II secretory pathway component PulJ